MNEIDFNPMAKSYFYPNLGFRTYRQHSALIPSVAYLHFKIRQIPVYSANPWIDSFAHIIYDVISQQSINFITLMIQTYKNK